MRVEPHSEEHGENGACASRALFEKDARWDSRSVAAVELHEDEDCDYQTETEEAAPDSRVVPGVDAATPLEGEEEADDGADEEEGTEEVDLADFLLGG